ALGIDVCIVGAEAEIAPFGVTLRWGLGVTFPRAGQPPPANLYRFCGIADVKNSIALVVELIARLKIRSAGRHVHIVTIAEPELVHAAGPWSRRINVGDGARVFRLGNVEELKTARRLS